MSRKCIPLLTAFVLAACGDDAPPGPPPAIGMGAPLAVIVADQINVFEGATVVLDGSPSSDPDDNLNGYRWEQASGPFVLITDESSPVATFVAPNVIGTQTLRFTLTVVDTTGLTGSASVDVTVVDTNQSPRAMATATDEVDAGEVFSLSAVGSSDRDGDGSIANYLWEQVAGTSASLTNPQMETAMATAPDVVAPEVLEFTITVTDPEGKTDSVSVFVRVRPLPTTLVFVNAPSMMVESDWPFLPMQVQIRNGSDRVITGGSEASLTITLSVETGNNNLVGTLQMRAVRGVAVFTDLEYDAPENGVVLRADTVMPPLTGLSMPFDVVETNQQAVVDAGPNQTIAGRTTGATLAGTANDPDGMIATYAWTQLSGPVVQLTDADMATATFDAPDVVIPTDLVFQLEVTDDGGKKNRDTTTVTVNPVAASLVFTNLPNPLVRNSLWTNVGVEVRNAAGNRITAGAPASYQINVSVQTGSGSLSGTTNPSAVMGVASLADVFYDTAETGVVFRAQVSVPPLSGVSSPINVVWSSALPSGFGSSGDEGVRGLAISGSNVILGGFHNGTIGDMDFDLAGGGTSAPAGSAVDAYIASYGTDGTINWVRTFISGMSDEWVDALSVASDGDVVATFRHLGTLAFDEMPFDATTGMVTSPAGATIARFTGSGASAGALEWAVPVLSGATLPEVRVGIDRDDVVLAGGFDGMTIDFDPCTASNDDFTATDTDIYIIKLDATALADDCATTSAYRFGYQIGSMGADTALDAAIDPATGDIYVAGSFSGSVDFNPDAMDTAVRDSGTATAHGFLLQLDRNGLFQWVRAFGGDTGTSRAESVTIDAAGNVWVAGQFEGDAFNPGFGAAVDSAGSSDVFVLSYSATGTFRVAQSFTVGGSGRDNGFDIVAGPGLGDAVYVTGSFESTVDFDPDAMDNHDLTANGGQASGFALSVDGGGDFDWAGAWGHSGGTTTGERIAMRNTMSGSELYVAGLSDSAMMADLDPGPASVTFSGAGGDDVILQKMSTNGAITP